MVKSIQSIHVQLLTVIIVLVLPNQCDKNLKNVLHNVKPTDAVSPVSFLTGFTLDSILLFHRLRVDKFESPA